jgi:hypothetical protein
MTIADLSRGLTVTNPGLRTVALDLDQFRKDVTEAMEALLEFQDAEDSQAVVTINVSPAELRRIIREAVDQAVVPRSYPRCLPLSQMAKRLGKHPSTVRAWARQKLHGYELAGRAGRELIVKLPEGLCL